MSYTSITGGIIGPEQHANKQQCIILRMVVGCLTFRLARQSRPCFWVMNSTSLQTPMTVLGLLDYYKVVTPKCHQHQADVVFSVTE